MKYWRVPFDRDKIDIPHGDIHITIDRCKGCSFCEEYCPRDVLKMSTNYNKKGYHYPDVIKQGECVNCCLCEMICPEFAIFCIESSKDTVQKGMKKGSNQEATS